MAQPNPQRKLVSPDLVSALGAVLIVGMMVVPLPSWLLDILLGFNITLALTIMLVVIYSARPLDFSSFPSMLLIVTLFRLALNISATRLILLHAEAGAIISAFGSVVVGGNYIVGLVVFIILVMIQFVVITNGAGRVAEVAARFTLDAMPGKQMAIDADLNAGLINEDEARERRKKIAEESDFYGAMDGASKFVRGDAIAAVIIIVVNILGGFTVGIVQHHMDLQTALQTYTLLTIGEGLVAQIPALLISTATGLVVTRANGETNLGANLSTQMLAQPKAIGTAAGVFLMLGLVPGIPKAPFLFVGTMAGLLAMTLSRQQAAASARPAAQEQPDAPKPPENLAELVGVDPLELEIGYGLIVLADRKQGGDLLDRVTALRRQMATESGFVTPPIRVRDNLQLKPTEYAVKLKGVEVARGESYPGQLLAMNPSGGSIDIPGLRTTEPAFGLPAVWIAEQDRSIAESLGCSVVDAVTVLITHLSEFVRSHASEIVTRQDVQAIIDSVKEKAPIVVDELVPKIMSVGEVQRVLCRLLDERVDVRDVSSILEALADHAPLTKDVDILVEKVRERLGRQITRQHTEPDGRLHVFTVDPRIEHHLSESLRQTENGVRCIIDPELLQKILLSVRDQMERIAMNGHSPLALVSAPVRMHFRRLVERNFPQLPVLSYNEIPTGVNVESTGMVMVEEVASAEPVAPV
ncbi:MAG: flagellar biosynthesis protein FlhA [Armatimonadetes bacterium]|nr:flagellar biosynthesis protein FlhA [Armatimonadota bacterium]